jgi:RNA polymerase sigma-70 factor (ECF subfamily)
MDVAWSDRLEQHSDAELVRLLVAGDHDAMAVIFDRYFRLVMSVALRILHDAGEAEDVVQTVFTDFYQKARLFDESKGNLKTWLLQYAYGRSFNQKRKLKFRGFYEQVEFDETQTEPQDERRERVIGLDSQEATRLVEQILPKLNEKQRSVIEQAFFEGRKLSEIASRTGESLGNVHHAYYRGIEKLRAYLTEPRPQSKGESSLLDRRFSWLRKAPPTPERLREEA